jgi:hypothetical protein
MYLASILLLLLVLPAASVAVELTEAHPAAAIVFLIGKWFTFWAVGIRLFIAGARQVAQPSFTAEGIFGIRDSSALPLVREIGFANLSIGVLGIWSLFHPTWLVPAAIVGGLYYGLAGFGHVFSKQKNAKEYAAMISDGFAFLVLLAFVARSIA